MTPLLQQFLSESRDVLQGVGERLLELEKSPGDSPVMGELFRLVHTLKGNCGLFDFPEMARVLHAAEDLMDVVRAGELAYSEELADRLLEAMDFVGMLLDEIEAGGSTGPGHAAESVRLAESLRQLLAASQAAAIGVDAGVAAGIATPTSAAASAAAVAAGLQSVPQSLRDGWLARGTDQPALWWIAYAPEPECFFKGEDPLFLARQVPGVLWQRVSASEPWAELALTDAYRCILSFQLITAASPAEIEEHFRYVPEQVVVTALSTAMVAASLEESGSAPAVSVGHGVPGSDAASFAAVIEAQRTVLGLPDGVVWLPGRLKGVAATLAGCCRSIGAESQLPALEAALEASLAPPAAAPLRDWLKQFTSSFGGVAQQLAAAAAPAPAAASTARTAGAAAIEREPSAVRRLDEAAAPARTLKVDQAKVDRLMNLIGEMVIAKNGLPYLAARAESEYGVRDLAREIKAIHAVVNRISEDMQDAIMQVRMLPVSFVFQRFARVVRDISKKLGKEVTLVLEGEDTEADKNIIEALADPLIHIVRNSLDHGIEMPAVRRAAGKPAAGRLVIRASQEADRVVIDISDDGAGIDPAVIKRKAYERGLIDEALLERISDQDAINLVFAAGFSTVDVVSDLSGRGVGMDVVRTAIERVNGSVSLESSLGQGTRLSLSLPLSLAVTNVMIVESDGQIFGVPMDLVVETVRVPRAAIHTIKEFESTVLRGRIVPLRSLNAMLASAKPQRSNAADEVATLVVRMQGEQLGIVVDDFREVVDIIRKPMSGILADLPGYAGSALLGNGSVLMVLNPKELVK
jgi:two-component system chemotaxis sensor kinase CheA